MALTPEEIAAVAKLRFINGGDQPTPGGLGNGGHREFFPDGLHAMADVTDAVAREAEAAATAAASASAQAASLSGTSTTSVAVSAGSKTLTTQAGKAFSPGTFLLLTSNASPTTHYIFGQVTAYSGTSLTIGVTSFAGSGSRADWTIRVAGGPGVQGGPGPAPTLTIGTVADGPTADADINGSDGSYTLDLTLPTSTVPGPPGAQVLNGARDPASGDGNDGDYWLQSADGVTGEQGDFWTKSGGSWTYLFSTKGPPGAGSGDMTGPNGGVVDGEIMVSNGTTGKALKGTGKSLADLATAAQGEKADSALQPAALDDYTPTSGLADVATSGDYADLENPPSIPAAPADIGAEPAGRLIGVNTVTGTSYTLVLTDMGRLVRMDNANANTLTVPTDASVAFPVGARIDVRQLGAGQTTIVGASGVSVTSVESKNKIAAQYGYASLVKEAANAWGLEGRLA